MGNILNTNGRTNYDLWARIGKAVTASIKLNKVWKSRDIAIPAKLRMFN